MSLVEKIRRARRALRRQVRLYRENQLRGHARAAKRQKGLVARYERLLEARQERRAALIKRGKRPGPWGWGGGKLVMVFVVYPIMKRRGISPTSGKRRETYGNPSSDHFFLNVWAFAKDWATTNNYPAAQEIRSALTPGELHNDYEEFFFTMFGVTFRGQIIAGTHGTGPHLHVGFKRIR